MMYRSDGSATFVGLERIVGHVAGKAGSFGAPTHWSIRERHGEGIPISSFLALAQESFEVCGARARRLLGTGLSIPLTLTYELG